LPSSFRRNLSSNYKVTHKNQTPFGGVFNDDGIIFGNKIKSNF